MSFIRKIFQSCSDYAKTAKALNTEAKIIYTNTNLGEICGNICGCGCVSCLQCSASLAGCVTKNKDCGNVSIDERIKVRATGQRYGKNSVATICCLLGCGTGCICCPIETAARVICKTDAPICNPYSRKELDTKHLLWKKTCIDTLLDAGPAQQTMDAKPSASI